MEYPDFDIFDEERIKELFDEMIAEFNRQDENQRSLKRDKSRRKIIELSPDTQYIRQLRYLARYSN